MLYMYMYSTYKDTHVHCIHACIHEYTLLVHSNTLQHDVSRELVNNHGLDIGSGIDEIEVIQIGSTPDRGHRPDRGLSRSGIDQIEVIQIEDPDLGSSRSRTPIRDRPDRGPRSGIDQIEDPDLGSRSRYHPNPWLKTGNSW